MSAVRYGGEVELADLCALHRTILLCQDQLNCIKDFFASYLLAHG